MELFIKNMVCDRCITTVKQQLDALSIEYKDVGLGEVTLRNPISPDQLLCLKDQLYILGFELLDDRKASIVTQVKGIIIRYIHGGDSTE